MKIAFIGPYDLVFPFKSLGADIIPETDKSIEEIRKEIEGSDYAIVFVFEELFKKLDESGDITRRADINIIPIPDISGSKGYGRKRISEMVRKAIGMDIGGIE